MNASSATVDSTLTIHGDLGDRVREVIVAQLDKLDHRLRSFRDDAVSLDLFVKEVDTPAQHLVFEATIAHWPKLVATTNGQTFEQALTEVRDELLAQITRTKSKHEPSHDRRRRRHPGD